MKGHLVSIIIPLYNRENYILETLRSITNQSYENWECILVDDGSTDNSYEVAGEYAKKDTRIKLFRRPENTPKGANPCRNFGFKQSKGAFIQWFDSDDTMYPRKIETELETLLKNPESHFVVSKTEMFDENLNESLGIYKGNLWSENAFHDFVSGRIGFTTTAVLFRREFLEGKDLFDEEIFRSQEWDFFSRLLMDNPKYVVIPEVLCTYRIHGQSISGNMRSNNAFILSSEFKARKKIHNLLKSKGSNPRCEKFVFQRFASILIKSINSDAPGLSGEVLREINKRFLASRFIFSVLQINIGVFFYSKFKKGYNLLKV